MNAETPIPMVLFCPECSTQHVDAVEHEGGQDCDTVTWNNPPHRSHLCHACGCIWRPADVPTTGVARIKTRGKADTFDASNALESVPTFIVEYLQLHHDEVLVKRRPVTDWPAWAAPLARYLSQSAKQDKPA